MRQLMNSQSPHGAHNLDKPTQTEMDTLTKWPVKHKTNALQWWAHNIDMELTIWIESHRWRWTHSQNSRYNPRYGVYNPDKPKRWRWTYWQQGQWNIRRQLELSQFGYGPRYIHIWSWRCWQKADERRNNAMKRNKNPAATDIGRQTFPLNVWIRYRLDTSSFESLTSSCFRDNLFGFEVCLCFDSDQDPGNFNQL